MQRIASAHIHDLRPPTVEGIRILTDILADSKTLTCEIRSSLPNTLTQSKYTIRDKFAE
jgi:hypothetical protein